MRLAVRIGALENSVKGLGEALGKVLHAMERQEGRQERQEGRSKAMLIQTRWGDATLTRYPPDTLSP